MSSKTQIGNLAMVRIGEALFVDVDADGTTAADEFNAIWQPILEETLGIGPEKGWGFAKWETSDVNVDNTSITAFADYSGTVAGTVLVTSAAHGLVTGDLATISGTTNYNSDYSITFVATDTFYIVEDFVADDATGTVQWTSLRLAFRYARPTSTRVTDVYDGGVPIDDWVRKGNWILTNLTSDDVEMDYIRAVADLTVSTFPAHFNEVMWRKMAIHMLYSRVQSRALQEQLISELEQIYLPRAIGMDSREKFVQEESAAWTDAGHTTTFIE